MTNKDKVRFIYEYMDEIYPNVSCELNYNKPYELLIAVVLSAQATDKSVNLVTPVLFSKYNDLQSLAHADIHDVENIIKPVGLYKNKAKSIISLSKILYEKYDGKIPMKRDELKTLPGVGNKTAGVTLIELFKIPNFPVDTHVSRVSKRLRLCNENDNPDEIETKLKKLFPEDKWIKLHHQFIHFGRYTCTSKNPTCENCKLFKFCKENIYKL